MKKLCRLNNIRLLNEVATVVGLQIGAEKYIEAYHYRLLSVGTTVIFDRKRKFCLPKNRWVINRELLVNVDNFLKQRTYPNNTQAFFVFYLVYN